MGCAASNNFYILRGQTIRPLKKFITILSILAALLLIAYIGGNYMLEKTAKEFITELTPKLEQKGISIENFSYGDISINSPKSIKIKNVDLQFKLKQEEFGDNSYTANFSADYVLLKLASISNVSGTFAINNFSIFVEPDDKRVEKPFGKIEKAIFLCGIPISLKHPEKDAEEVLREVEKLFDTNSAQRLELIGDVQLGIDGKEVGIGLITEKHGDYVSLQFDKDDIFAASKEFELELTEKEAEVIANYPSKVPAMLRITREAKQKSQHQGRRDKNFPEDAYRHIYWSYHLTRVLGPEISKEITDAHETAPGNTKKERLMDFHNNEVGRGMAKVNYSDEDLIEIVLRSKEIIRNPNSVKISSREK